MPDIFVEPESHHKIHEEQISHAHPDDDAIHSANQLMHHTEKTIGVLTSYCLRPKGITFVNQESDEIIVLFLRHHFITNVPWIIATFFLFLFPVIIYSLFQITNIVILSIPPQMTFIITSFYYLVVLGYAFGKFVSWFYNIGVVTQKRIVDLDTSNILAHESASANLGEIVDVKFAQNGFFQSFFNYGDILIQTEAIHANFEFIATPYPTKVTDIISDMRVAMKHQPKKENHATT